jgi:hypothetical protein
MMDNNVNKICKVHWLSLEFKITGLSQSPPSPSEAFNAVMNALESESAESDDDSLKSLAHLTKSLAKFEPVLVAMEASDSKQTEVLCSEDV